MDTKQIQELSICLRELLGNLQRSCYYFRKQQIYRGVMVGQELWQDIARVIEKISVHLDEINGEDSVVDIEGLLTILRNLQEAQENGDYVLLSDLYELQLIPIITSIQERLVVVLGVHVDEINLRKNILSCADHNFQILQSLFSNSVIHECLNEEILTDKAMQEVVSQVEKCIADGYVVEPTSSGYLTAAVREEDHLFYLHTNGQIIQEAILQAEEWLNQGQLDYSFYGLGMGYPFLEMLSMDDNVSVTVVEMNRNLLFLAFVFAPLWKLFESGRFELVYDPTGHRMERMELGLTKEKGFYVFYPALHGVQRAAWRGQLESYFVEESSVRIHGRSMMGNFRKNREVSFGNIQDLSEKFQGREVIIVAAGPSLDKNMLTLKKRNPDILILAVGTVLHKLLDAGIRPDYVIMIDSGRPTYRQIEGIERCGVPLIFLSTLYSKILEEYQGEKYLLCQKGFAPAEELAAQNGWQTVESGGSVATVALDLMLRLSVKKIIFVGLDLAYTDGVDHAKGTAYRAKVVNGTRLMVPGVDGSDVETGKNLKIYLHWIEQRLAARIGGEKQIPVIDATEGGALKQGMELCRLEEVLS